MDETLTVEHSKAFELIGVAKNRYGSPLNLAAPGLYLRFEARLHYGDVDPIIRKLNADIAISGADNDNYLIACFPSETADLPNDGRITRLYFGFQASTGSTDPHTLRKGTIIVTPTPITTAP